MATTVAYHRRFSRAKVIDVEVDLFDGSHNPGFQIWPLRSVLRHLIIDVSQLDSDGFDFSDQLITGFSKLLVILDERFVFISGYQRQ